MAEEEFKAKPVLVVPILGSLVISVVCGVLFLKSEVQLASVMLPETGAGPWANAVIFVLASGLGATMIYVLLKRGVLRFLRFLMGAAFSVLTFSLSLLYSELFLEIVGFEVPAVAVLALASVVTVFAVAEIVRRGKFYEVIVLVFGGATGSLLGASIPVLSAVLILLLLAVYDVVAVFRGPVGKIASKGLEHLPGASFTFRNVHVGLGDLTFYSMLVTRMLLSFGWQACVAATLGVLAGAYLSMKMVERKGIFPGLPFSVLLGLLAGLIIFAWM